MKKNVALMLLTAVFAAGSLITSGIELISANAAPAPTPSPRKIKRGPTTVQSPVTVQSPITRNANLKPTGNEVAIESRTKRKKRRPRTNR